MNAILNKFKQFDMPLAITSGMLILAGLSLLYATSVSGKTMEIFYKQLSFVVLGIVSCVFFSFYNYHNLAKNSRWVYLIFIILLLTLLFWGRSIRGSSRWFDLGFFNFQPAEFVKLVVVLGLSRWMYLKRGQINSWKNLLITFAYVFIPAGLVLLEPDLGSATIIMSVWAGIILISPISKKFLISLLIIFLIVVGVSWEFVLQDYQKHRVEVFLNPQLEPRGKGYNVRQAIIAVGSGQFAGAGLGQGLQSQLKFLPERQTDFIFASSAEEIGFLGSIALLVLYAYLLIRMLKIMGSARDDLGMYIVGGVFFMFFPQIVINIGMNIGILPVTGIPLPFLSYGGSSLLVIMTALGIVQSVARQSKNLHF